MELKEYREQKLVYSVKLYAIDLHKQVNQIYGGYLPYQYHLELVQAVAKKYLSYIPTDDRAVVLASCWLHDTLEDCHVSYNDVYSQMISIGFAEGEAHHIAEIVYAVTNDKGRTRKERAGENYYKGIKAVKYATFVKLCDRIANVIYSCMFGSKKFTMYRKENKDFCDALMNENLKSMFLDLNNLFETKQFGFEPDDKTHCMDVGLKVS